MFFSAFTRLFHREQPAPVPAESAFDGLDQLETFPRFSETSARALALVNDPCATLAELSELIQRDGMATTAILKLANSASVRGRTPIETIPQATSRLGIKGCRQVLTAICVRETFRAPSPQVTRACDALHRHALLTGALAVRLGDAGQLGFRGEEFTAGLLHDIGRVILCARAPVAFARIDPMTFLEDPGTPERERAAIATDHCEVGFRFARVNALPRPIAEAIRHHHAPRGADGQPVLAALTAAADELANHVQRERRLTNFRPETGPGFAALRALVTAPANHNMLKALSVIVVGALREVRTMLRLTDR